MINTVINAHFNFGAAIVFSKLILHQLAKVGTLQLFWGNGQRFGP